MNKTAFITGICGQDGPYLAQFLLEKGYHVIGTTRSLATKNDLGLRYLGIKKDVEIIELNDFSLLNLKKILTQHQPNEIYNLAAQSSVGESFVKPLETIQENVMSVLSWLEAIKLVDQNSSFYQASSSEMYGNVRLENLPIQEGLIFNPASPYGISKATAHWLTVNYREAHGLRTGCGILFNHESALRGSNYVIKKVIHQAILIKQGKQKKTIRVGNLAIKRDWGYAPKYVQAMWKILQQDKLDDYHICSGNLTSLNDFVRQIFDKLNIDSELYLEVDLALYRPVDLEAIYGDNRKAKHELDWKYDMSTTELIEQLIKDEYHFMEWKVRN